jgi:ABC-type amino acid transport system permease subunit
MIKDSALISTISVGELFWRAQRIGRSEHQVLASIALAALVYWGLTIIFSFFQERLEQRMARGDR